MKNEVKNSMLQLLKIAVITALVYLVFRYLLGLVFPFLIAYGIAVLLNPLLEKINRHWKIKRGILSALLVLLVFAVAGGLLGMAGYALISQAKKLVRITIPLPHRERRYGICAVSVSRSSAEYRTVM